MPKRPTIVDVAQRAGVSKSTVSLVLNQSPTVKAKTRERVEAAIAETGYVYHRGAANLRGASSGLIGLIINNLRNPFYSEMAISAQMRFAEQGYVTVVANSNEDPSLQKNLIHSMLEHGVDALIVAPAYGGARADFDPVVRVGIPALQVLRQVDPRLEALPFCSMDYERGSYLATDHLLASGASNVAFVGGVAEHPITSERKSGYLARLDAAGIAPSCWHGRPSRAFGYEMAQRLARAKPRVDAAVAFSDLVALGMLAGFAEAGLRLGADFRLVGFDDIEEAAQCFPKLSTVRCDVNAFGKWTAGLLLAWLQDHVHPGTPERMPVELIVRASS